MVEGAGNQRTDRGGHPVRVRQHSPRRDSHDPQSLFAQEPESHFVARRPSGAIMRFAVDLDHQSGFAGKEVHDIGTDRMLAPELRAGPAATQLLPEQYFRRGQVAAQPSRDRHFGAKRMWTPPSTGYAGPPPRTGEDNTHPPAHRLPSTSSASNRWIAAGSALRLTFSVIGVAAPVTHSVRSLSRSNVPALSTAKRVIDR